MHVEAEEIPEYFQAYGWQFERSAEGVYRTGFVGDTGHYEIWVRVTDQWVYFVINPYVNRSEDHEHGEEVLSLLLQANHEVNLAKFALDEEGDVLLAVELPSESFGYSHFADALTALSHYADLYRERFDDAVAQECAEVV